MLKASELVCNLGQRAHGEDGQDDQDVDGEDYVDDGCRVG